MFFFKGSEVDGLHELQSQPNDHRKLPNAYRETRKITYFAWNLPEHWFGITIIPPNHIRPSG